MKKYQTNIEGCYGFEISSFRDNRGETKKLVSASLEIPGFTVARNIFVSNLKVNTLRGLHFQSNPLSENKVLQSLSGKILDRIIDLRKDSKTYLNQFIQEVGPEEKIQGLFIPAGCAHGYLTLKPNSSMIYLMDKDYSESNVRGIRWNDPLFEANWPEKPFIISDRDKSWPNFNC